MFHNALPTLPRLIRCKGCHLSVAQCCAGLDTVNADTVIYSFPEAFPDNIVLKEDWLKAYSLPLKMRELMPIRGQVADLKSWLGKKGDLTRKGTQLAQGTVDSIVKVVWNFLGFQHKYLGKTGVPSLWDFLDSHAYASYISFQIAKGNAEGTIRQWLSVTKRIMQFLECKSGSSLKKQIKEHSKWLENMQSHISSMTAKPDELEDDLPPAHMVVRRIEDLRQQALAALPSDRERRQRPDTQLTLPTAKLVHDALMTTLMFGYIAPIRCLCIRTLQMPGAKAEDGSECLYPGCQLPKCRGNRLVETAESQFQLYLSHYKTEKK